MAVLLGSGDEQRRLRKRNIVVAALATLLILWTVKLSFPQHTVLSVYSNHTPYSSSNATVDPIPDEKTKTPSGKTEPESTNSGLAGMPFNGLSSTKAAVIIETRFRQNLVPLILHFSSVLGPTWPIKIYTDAESVALFSASAALNRYFKSGIIEIRVLPQTVLFTNSNSVSAFLTEKWLWEDLAPAENILIFQSDSMLCANAARSVDDFFAYDFVGAPIEASKGKGYNGGLSLRKASTTLRVLERYNWAETQKPGDRFEDQWYFNRMTEMQQEEALNGTTPEQDGAINLPSMEVARTFSVETIDYPHPLGVHQVNRWLQQHSLSLDEWCPEYKMCSDNYVIDS